MGARRRWTAPAIFGLPLALTFVWVDAAPAAAGSATASKAGKCAKKRTRAQRKRCNKQRPAQAPVATPQPGNPGPPASPGGSGSGGSGSEPAGPYSGRFVHDVHSFAFGQAPTWSADGQRVVDQRKVDGVWQVFTAKVDGSDPVCVTCGQVGPNMVGQYRPQGDKILFHSWRDDPYFQLGAPGFGGVGSDVFVINADGSGDAVNLTRQLEKWVTGAASDGQGEDNYHAYFSPDGNKISWTHLDCNFITQDGRCMMEILVADYVEDAEGPRLENVKIARPQNGAYYETQLWAPDGSGFLYTESVDNSLNLELFFYDVRDDSITRLTRNPAWDEQATFTPDMKKVIFMSTRDHPGFFNTYRNIADALGIGRDSDFLMILPIFEASFLQPVAQESTDLYELDLASGAVRRLTHTGDDGWIIPEFMWDPNSERLIWTEARFPDGMRMQLPIDPQRDLTELIEYLAAGNVPKPDPTHPGALELLAIDRRTQLGHYEP